MASAEVTGFPPVEKLSLFQGSLEKPGKIVIETPVVGAGNLTTLPRITTLSVTAGGVSGTWSDVRVVKVPRQYPGYMRTVLEDSRWKLRETTLSANRNIRNGAGVVLTDSQKTITELVAYIATETGLTISVGSVPSFNPTAMWMGVDAATAMRQLLDETGCRLVYNAVTGQYLFEAGDAGTDPTIQSKFRPAPVPRYEKLVVRSMPVIYEDELDVTAVNIDRSTGGLTTLTTPTVPTSSGDLEKNTDLRMWKVDSVSHPEAGTTDQAVLLPYRPMCHVYDPEHPAREAGRIVRDESPRWPMHQQFISPDERSFPRVIRTTSGGSVFVTEHPVLMTAGSNFTNSAKLITGYYFKDGDDKLKRLEEELTIDGSASGTLTITIPWMHPADSTESDFPSEVWSTLLTDMATAIKSRYSVDAKTVESPSFNGFTASGRIGAVSLKMNTSRLKSEVVVRAAIGYDPANEGSI